MQCAVLTDLTARWVTTEYAPLLFAVLLFAGIGTVLLFYFGLITYYRRRSREYLLLTLALGALVLRTIIGLGTVVGVVPMVFHHILDHGLDFIIVSLILYTVYRSRSTHPTVSDSRE